MQMTGEAILEAALSLPEGERLALVSRLLETMPAELLPLSLDDPGLVEELDRRFTDSSGELPWSQLRDEK